MEKKGMADDRGNQREETSCVNRGGVGETNQAKMPLLKWRTKERLVRARSNGRRKAE